MPSLLPLDCTVQFLALPYIMQVDGLLQRRCLLFLQWNWLHAACITEAEVYLLFMLLNRTSSVVLR